MKESFGHRRLISALDPPVQAKVRGLKGHLYESIGAEPVAGDEVLSVTLELQRLTVILADQIT